MELDMQGDSTPHKLIPDMQKIFAAGASSAPWSASKFEICAKQVTDYGL